MQGKGLRVLVVDDEPQIQKLLKVSLGAHGYEMEEALTGEAGIRMAAMLKPDLLIVDLGLPDMDGKAVVAAIRAWSTTPIIVLTARDQEQEKIEALRTQVETLRRRVADAEKLLTTPRADHPVEK